MAGKEDGPSKANGVATAEDKGKGKGKGDDPKDQKTDQEIRDTEQKDGKLLPPGSRAHVYKPTA